MFCYKVSGIVFDNRLATYSYVFVQVDGSTLTTCAAAPNMCSSFVQMHGCTIFSFAMVPEFCCIFEFHLAFLAPPVCELLPKATI